MIRIQLCGAAGGVTGSGQLIDTGLARVLVDFGIFQDGPDARGRSRSLGPVNPRQLSAALLTHAHIDHCGRMPLLVANGYQHRLHATPATLELTRLLLDDMARIEKEDLKRVNRQRQRAGEPALAPLFTQAHVEHLMRRANPLRLGRSESVARGVSVTAHEAGHILGSASLALDIESDAGPRRIVFSGDLGAPAAPILRDPDPPQAADMVFLESTYGGRQRPDSRQTVERFKTLIEQAVKDGARVIIPAFAVGRTQVILYYLAEAVREGRLPADFPIYLDSPMATTATEITGRHVELYDDQTRALYEARRIQADLRGLQVTASVNESMALNYADHPCIILSASGMCEGGRIVHHLKHNLWRPNARVLLVGYMARNTLGRRLLEKPSHVDILGERIAINAEIHHLDGFSAHADHNELLNWLAPMAANRPRIILVHGEDEARQALAQAIRERYQIEPELPTEQDTIELK